jgi:ribosomal protein S10
MCTEIDFLCDYVSTYKHKASHPYSTEPFKNIEFHILRSQKGNSKSREQREMSKGSKRDFTFTYSTKNTNPPYKVV